MWILIGAIAAFFVWELLKLSIVSLYVLLFAGIVLGAVPYFAKPGRRKSR